MARCLFRKVSFAKTVAAYRSMWKRVLLRLFFPGYGMKGMGWLRNPKKAFYNWIYHRTSISIPRLLGYKPSLGGTIAALFVASLFNVALLPVDTAKAASKSVKIKKAAKERGGNFGKVRNFTDNKFHEPRVKKTTATNEAVSSKTSTPKVYATKAEKPKQEIATANVSKNTGTAEAKVETKMPVKNTRVSSMNTTSPNAKVNRISTSEIVANTYKNDTPKPLNNASKEPIAPIDENTPKSKPKNANDQYIKKRMILESPDEAILSNIKAETYLDVVKDEESERIMLIIDGHRVGFVAQADSAAVLTCLRLGRKMYAVITDSSDKKFEFEMWFGK